jgi:general secretion pathway protein G
MKGKRGFTLVEILIVVVILGILAAIVIPQFTGASTEAKLSSLVSDLQSMRSQIELYKLQHNEAVPSFTDAADPTGAMVNGLTGCTLVNGTLVAPGDPNGFGPYLMKMPTNQFNMLSTVAVDGTIGTGATSGWVYRTSDSMMYPAFIDMDGDNVCSGTDQENCTSY